MTKISEVTLVLSLMSSSHPAPCHLETSSRGERGIRAPRKRKAVSLEGSDETSGDPVAKQKLTRATRGQL